MLKFFLKPMEENIAQKFTLRIHNESLLALAQINLRFGACEDSSSLKFESFKEKITAKEHPIYRKLGH
jgi:hypothetical protein